MRCRSCSPLSEEVRHAAGLLERRFAVSILIASHEGAVRFNEFLQMLGPVPPATLASRLTELERAGILERVVVDARPPRAEYHLTALGAPSRRSRSGARGVRSRRLATRASTHRYIGSDAGGNGRSSARRCLGHPRACGRTVGAIALGTGTTSRDTTLSLPTLSGPATRPPSPTITSTISSSTTSAVVGSPFTLTPHWQDVNISTAFTGTVDGFGDGVSVQTAQSDTGPCDRAANAVQCPLGGLAPGSEVGAAIVVVASTPGTYTFASNGFGTNPSNSVSVTVVPAPPPVPVTVDVAVQAPLATLHPNVGRTSRAGLQIRNVGTVADNTTTLALTVPRQVRLVAATAQAGACDLKLLTCSLGPLATHGSNLVILTFKAITPGKGRVVAHVTCDVPDSFPTNNLGTISIAVPKPLPKPKHH